MPDPPVILLIEDEVKISSMVKEYLESKGFVCRTAVDGERGLAILNREDIDLTLLDWMLPGMNGLEVAVKIRKQSDMPIIMLTARDAEEDKVIGLENGADDYVVKPFSFKELAARINAHLRRSERSRKNEAKDEVIRPPFRLNRRWRRVWKGEVEIELTAMRFDLFTLFLEHPGLVFTREQIMEYLSGDGFYEGFDRTIDAHIKNLRKLVEDSPASPRYILTVRGVGYKFQDYGNYDLSR